MAEPALCPLTVTQTEPAGARPSLPQNGSGYSVHTTRLSRQTWVNRVLTLNPNRNPVKSQKPAWKSQGISPADFSKLQNNNKHNNKNTYRNQGYQVEKKVSEWAGRQRRGSMASLVG